MYSWDPEDVEKIVPFTPSRCQKQESTWRVDDVDRITPFIPIRQSTWTVDDVDHIESFVPTSPVTHNADHSSSSQYDTANARPELDAQHLNVQSRLNTSTAKVSSTSPAAQDSELNSSPQSRPSDQDLDLHFADTSIDKSRSSEVSSSQSFRSTNNSSGFDLDTSGEFVHPKSSSSFNLEHSEYDSDTSNEYVDPKCSSSEYPTCCSNSEDDVEEEKLQDTSDTSLGCEIQKLAKDEGFNLDTLLHVIGSVCTSNSSVCQGKVSSNNCSSVLEPDLNTSNEDADSSSQHVSSNSSLDLDPTQYNLDDVAEYLQQMCSSSASFRPSCNTATSVSTQYDIDTLVEILRQQCSSNSRVEHTECDPAGASNDDKYVSDGCSLEFVIQKPAEEKEMSHRVGAFNMADYRDDSSCSSEEDDPLPVCQGERELYNPYTFSQTCIAATNSFGRGKHLSADLKDEGLDRRLRMNADIVPSMGRGTILQTCYNRHRTDESLNKQLRKAVGVGYSNETIENFWRGEQQESEPLDKPPEVDDLIPAAESVSLSSDIICVSPGNRIASMSPKKSCEQSPVKSFESQSIECVSPGNTIPSMLPKKPPERPLITTVTVKKSVSPGKKIGSDSRPSSSASQNTQDSSPKKKKKAAAASRKNRNALLSSLAIQKEAKKQVTPGMPPDGKLPSEVSAND